MGSQQQSSSLGDSSAGGLEEIAETHSNRSKFLAGAESDTFTESQSYVRQLFAGRRRRGRRVATSEHVEFAGLEFQNDGAGDSGFLARGSPRVPASLRIIGSVSLKGTPGSKMSSDEIDCVGRSATTSLSSMPRANRYRRAP
jgi:hypothetical protein